MTKQVSPIKNHPIRYLESESSTIGVNKNSTKANALTPISFNISMLFIV